jgi:hypothetical protein
MNYQVIACEQAKHPACPGALAAALPRPFGYYWIQVEQDGPWVAAFWCVGHERATGFFDCSNSNGARYLTQVHAVGGPVTPPVAASRPEALPEGYHWVQGEVFGDWVVALWKNEPYSYRGKQGHGYFDASNWWNSNYHIIPVPHAYGGKVIFSA